MLRVIAGKAKNINLQAPSKITRPMTDRIKTSMFDILSQEVEEAKILDLYAGSGSLGIESLSRGAKKAIFIDNSYESQQVIHANLKSTGFEKEGFFLKSNVDKYLQSTNEDFDIIFLDPPFPLEEKEKLWMCKLSIKALSQNGILIFRHPHKEKYPTIISYEKRQMEKVYEKKYGISILAFYRI